MGRFLSWKSPGKQPIKKRPIKRFLIQDNASGYFRDSSQNSGSSKHSQVTVCPHGITDFGLISFLVADTDATDAYENQLFIFVANAKSSRSLAAKRGSIANKHILERIRMSQQMQIQLNLLSKSFLYELGQTVAQPHLSRSKWPRSNTPKFAHTHTQTQTHTHTHTHARTHAHARAPEYGPAIQEQTHPNLTPLPGIVAS